MQLYAIDRSGEVVGAELAHKAEDYACLECAGAVRLRGGPHRQSHFFHLAGAVHCRQNGKSLAHLEAQRFLQHLLGSDACRLEVRFPQINRIADVVWEAKRLIFEIQCSAITAEEIAARNADYARIGYQVIWLLHASQFNRSRVSAAEMVLRDRPYYFTDMSSEGVGGFYDQFDVIEKGWRVHRLKPLSVDLSEPRQNPNGVTYFAGDLIDTTLTQPESPYLLQAQELQRAVKTERTNFLHRIVVRPYQILFRLLLEKVSR